MIAGLSWIKLAIIVAILAALTTAYFGWRGQQREIGRQEVRAEWHQANETDKEAKAKEGLRRIERQEENQRAQNAELARWRAAARRNAADRDRVQRDAEQNARDWAERLADSPTAADIAAAGAAIAVCADVRGRLDRAASELAAYASAARAAGLKCEADYDSLTDSPP